MGARDPPEQARVLHGGRGPHAARLGLGDAHDEGDGQAAGARPVRLSLSPHGALLIAGSSLDHRWIIA
eukprot:5864905-Prymnesium_polylepis.1